jgi:hypothetical protein
MRGRTPDVVEFGMRPFSWRRHSCLLGRDSGLLRSWNWVEPGGGARLQPAADFSPPAAGLTSLAGGRAEARRRLKSAPPSKRSSASGGTKWLTLISPGQPRLRGDIRSSETHLDPLRERHPPSRSAEKSLGAADTCLRQVLARVNFPNYRTPDVVEFAVSHRKEWLSRFSPPG